MWHENRNFLRLTGAFKAHYLLEGTQREDDTVSAARITLITVPLKHTFACETIDPSGFDNKNSLDLREELTDSDIGLDDLSSPIPVEAAGKRATGVRQNQERLKPNLIHQIIVEAGPVAQVVLIKEYCVIVVYELVQKANI